MMDLATGFYDDSITLTFSLSMRAGGAGSTSHRGHTPDT